MNKTLRLLALAAGLASAGPVLAQTPAKETPPAPAPPRDFALPAPKQFVLDNGLSVTLVSYGNTPKVNVGLYVAAGNSYEKAGEVWLGDLTGQLMREGTATRASAQISKSAAQMGGQVDISVGADTASVSGSSLSEFAPDLVKLVADLALNPKFPAGELERLKADNLRRLSIAKSNPQQMAVEKFREVVYGDHPYGRIFPTEAQMKGYTLAQAQAFYEANWAASRARLYVAGRFDAAAVETAIRAAFAGWKKGAMSHPAPPKPRADRAVYIVDKPGAVQTTLIVGLPTIDASQKDAIPLAVTNNVLGGYFSSRMTANLRENKGYTYSPYSQVSNRYRDATWAQNADVTTAVTGASLKEIFHEIDRLQAEAPGEAELESVKNYMLGTFVLRNSDRFGIISQLEFINFHGLPADYLNRYVGNVRAVTPAAVQQMAQKYIDDTKTAIIAVGDKKVIEEQVKPYGPIWSTTR
ncbi:MAG TPA: pitrilysin family protein [Vicinamibacteria bacterium]|nr:pitrilysin family protein [Vicinamibacteria bacterium]